MTEKISLISIIEQFKERQKVIVEKHQELQKLQAEYKADMKKTFGLSDGEQTNVLEIIETMTKLMGMNK